MPSQKPGIHVTQTMMYDWSLVIVYFFVSCLRKV